MKKSLMFISMLAMMAGNAFAADVLEAGTAEAPKYYVIKANRGIPYVTYSAEEKDNGGAKTHLYRANEVSEAAVWAVVPGTEDGAVNIYNYTTKNSSEKAYIIDYVTEDGSEFTGKTGAVATTTGEAVNVFTNNYGDGSYGISIINKYGFKNLEGGGSVFYALDATGGSSEFMGNWWCTNGGGTRWLFYAVDDTDGIEAGIEGVKTAIIKREFDIRNSTPIIKQSAI